MAQVLEIDGARGGLTAWSTRAADVLETGGVLLFPQLAFPLADAERALAAASSLAPRSKNISLDPATGVLGGHALQGEALATATAMTSRYADFATDLITRLLPGYGPALQRRRTSFRPGAIAQRALSARKDDRRLHVDAFPSSPVQGRRILRVFTNVDPEGRDRIWEVGDEDFEAFSLSFSPHLQALGPRGSGGAVRALMKAMGVTRGLRTAYDQAMLELHDAAKLDATWQAQAAKARIAFPAGSTWIVYTDGVLHAALEGQNAFEQTFLMPVEAMVDPERSPLRTLERLTGRALV